MKVTRSKTSVRRKFESAGGGRPIDIAFWLQDWEDGYNVGGLFRVADAVGAKVVLSTGRTPHPGDNPMIAVTSLGHHRRVPFRPFEMPYEAAGWLRKEGYTIVAVEVTDDAVDYLAFDYPDKVCFVLGNEAEGMYGTTLREVDACVYIPQFGKGRSMNVVVAGALVGFEARRSKRVE